MTIPATSTVDAAVAPNVALWRDLLTLAKPRVIMLLAITSLCGSLAAAAPLGVSHLVSLNILLGTLGLVLASAGANSINMWYDRDIDPLMRRTAQRPLPTGRLKPPVALVYGLIAVPLGTFVAGLASPLSGAMALFGALFYVFIYTVLLKRRTVQNIVIGGAAGAFPPLVGWAAVTGSLLHPLPWLMFAVIFFWTPPHFWALALITNADYTRAGIPMYPVIHGEAATRRAILRYLVLLLAVTIAGAFIQPLGPFYLAVAVGLGAWWLVGALQLLRAAPTKAAPQPARRVFTQSLYYLAFLFLAMVLDSFL